MAYKIIFNALAGSFQFVTKGGTGDVIGPATNTDAYVPQWNGANSKTLKDGLPVGSANGIATLDSGGKVPVTQLPSSIMEYKGTWAASTNTPTLANGTGDAGDVYVASDAGTVNFGAGAITFAAGDWVIYSGSVWQKSINSNAVASVNGYTGVVVLNKTDVGLGNVDNTTDANKPVSTATQNALDLKSDKLTPVATKTANYTANANEFVPCNVSGGSFAVTLPSAPADKTRVRVQLLTVGTSTHVEIKTGGTDKFFATAGPTSLYMYLYGETQEFQYQAASGFWNGISMSPPSNYAYGFPGVDSITPISNSNIAIDATARTLTITPPLGFFNVYVDGNGGKMVKFRKTTVVFGDGSGTSGSNTWTDTSGMWYFYLNSSGQPVTTQTEWTTEDFPNVVPIYRILWNATLAGSAKIVRKWVEYHINDIPADAHAWFHLNGAIWAKGFTMINNAITSGSPNADGRNSVVALTTGQALDDNLEYTVTNSTAGTDWTQDMGNTTAGSLNATNGGLFQIRSQTAGGLVSFLTATRFPFPYNAVSNIPQYITSTGTRTDMTSTDFLCVFLYVTQDPDAGKAVSAVTSAVQFTSITNARAYTWTDIQNTYSQLADGEIRPLYRLIFEYKSSYDAGAKYMALRETQDLRKAAVTTTTAATGSIPATNVTYVPYGSVSSTNVQSAIDELADEKVPLSKVAVSTALMTENAIGFTLAGGTTSKTLTVPLDATVSGTNTGDQNLSGYAPLDNPTFTTKVTTPAIKITTGAAAGKFLQSDANGDASWQSVSGTGDVVGPATNTADYIPQWNGANSKTLKDGLAVPTGGLMGLTPRVTTITSNANPTVNTDTCNFVTITAQAEAIASMTTNLSGSPSNFQSLTYRIKDNGTARAITWGASFAARGVALPTTTTLSKVLMVGFRYNSATSTWDCIAATNEA